MSLVNECVTCLCKRESLLSFSATNDKEEKGWSVPVPSKYLDYLKRGTTRNELRDKTMLWETSIAVQRWMNVFRLDCQHGHSIWDLHVIAFCIMKYAFPLGVSLATFCYVVDPKNSLLWGICLALVLFQELVVTYLLLVVNWAVSPSIAFKALCITVAGCIIVYGGVVGYIAYCYRKNYHFWDALVLAFVCLLEVVAIPISISPTFAAVFIAVIYLLAYIDIQHRCHHAIIKIRQSRYLLVQRFVGRERQWMLLCLSTLFFGQFAWQGKEAIDLF
ncbi:hypothetical protein RFI_18297 [Reticulomyxa filosa]|uniref:Uncharacterized protein n=1 Tax=Reticulomyxa filosa TaxID=46433 RepID=X6MYS5_RETFI|nr:hypothetical protein RFI_18297 [Reticulomyxa filosa]|eukprot:ETO18946.1 hypothetical protein RFI_18297 [Reticulomyxa filosa]